jgi:hypothetical protein
MNIKPYFTYDIETMFNCFLFSGKFLNDPTVYTFEVSEFKDQRNELLAFLNWLRYFVAPESIHASLGSKALMVGFNSLGFDYPIVHDIMVNPHWFTYQRTYQRAQQIINSEDRFAFTSWERDRLIPQLDLYLLHHFDNAARKTSLKKLEFNMRSDKIMGLEFDPHTPLTREEILKLIEYNVHDVLECEKFLRKSQGMIDMRFKFMDQKFVSGDLLNWNNTKIGKQFLIQSLGKELTHNPDGSKKQTKRNSVPINQVMLPVEYTSNEGQEVYNWYKNLIAYPYNNVSPKLEMKLAGVKHDFGLGGIHAAEKHKIFETNEQYEIIDIDVAAFYMSNTVVNRWYPEHLGDTFVDKVDNMLVRRRSIDKKSIESAILKLSLNGSFGDTNSEHSVLHDPKYLYSVTVNGQLLNLKLVEMLWSMVTGFQLIQNNTDGITCYIPKSSAPQFDYVFKQWQKETKLTLERVTYTKFFAGDVNSYLAIDSKGNFKRKGSYWYPTDEQELNDQGLWHKDFSEIVVQKVAERCLIDGYNPEFLLATESDPFDFCIRKTIRKSDKMFVGDKEYKGKIMRYYVSKTGQPLKTVSEPKGTLGAYKRRNSLDDSYFYAILNSIPEGTWDERIHTSNKSKNEYRTTQEPKVYLVKECNDISKFDRSDVDLEYYLEKIYDLINLKRKVKNEKERKA